jgi:hypothetical protein
MEEFRGKGSGIPHLAKNERDVGHPGVSSGEESTGWIRLDSFNWIDHAGRNRQREKIGL